MSSISSLAIVSIIQSERSIHLNHQVEVKYQYYTSTKQF